VLSKEDNEILTRVGPGTPMGNLLRRYWIPACLTSEIDEPDGPPARVRLLGEDLVAFRDTNGDVGLIEEQCPHRGASLFYGRNEECGLRCTYHGWKFDVTGQCTDQRSELHPFAQKIKVTSYPVRESGGIVWTYMGPAETMTPFRDFGTDSLPASLVAANKELVRCNWVQSMDGDLDTAHISNLHQFDAIDDVPDDGTDRPGYPSNYMSMKLWRHDPRSLIEVNDEWHGFRYAGIRTTPNGHRHVRVTAWIFPFCDIIAAIPFNTRLIMVVPADDYNCQRYNFVTTPPANPRGLGGPPFFTYEKYPFEMLPPSGVVERKYTPENDYLIDRVAQKGVDRTAGMAGRANPRRCAPAAARAARRHRERRAGRDRRLRERLRLCLRQRLRPPPARREDPRGGGAGRRRSGPVARPATAVLA
jgi:phthalate 4,5-dioxygenase